MHLIPQERRRLTGNVSVRPRRLLPGLVMLVEEVIEQRGLADALPCPPPPGRRGVELDAWMERDAKRREAAWKPVRTEYRLATLQDVDVLLAYRRGVGDEFEALKARHAELLKALRQAVVAAASPAGADEAYRILDRALEAELKA